MPLFDMISGDDTRVAPVSLLRPMAPRVILHHSDRSGKLVRLPIFPSLRCSPCLRGD
jgi:hypothetical protein